MHVLYISNFHFIGPSNVRNNELCTINTADFILDPHPLLPQSGITTGWPNWNKRCLIPLFMLNWPLDIGHHNPPISNNSVLLYFALPPHMRRRGFLNICWFLSGKHLRILLLSQRSWGWKPKDGSYNIDATTNSFLGFLWEIAFIREFGENSIPWTAISLNFLFKRQHGQFCTDWLPQD